MAKVQHTTIRDGYVGLGSHGSYYFDADGRSDELPEDIIEIFLSIDGYSLSAIPMDISCVVGVTLGESAPSDSGVVTKD